jgi:lysozyme
MNSFLPSTRPRITREDALRRAGIDSLAGVVVIGLRGYYQDTTSENKRGIYDDALCVVGPEHFSAYNGNTDPSAFRPGIATLRPGVYPYKPGKHGISRPGGGYPAFRPATTGEKLPVYRDGESNPQPGVAINIHRGSNTGTSSLGCQTIPPAQWEAFRSAVMDQLKRTGQKSFAYHLIG